MAYFTGDNVPFGGEGWLIQFQPKSGDGNIKRSKFQIYFTYDGNAIKRRVCNWDTQTWTEWVNL